MNYSIKIDLLKVNGAYLAETTEKKKCVVIPVDESGLYLGEKGVYLNVTANELREMRFDQTHMLKVELSREAYQALSEEQRRQLPIIGNMKAREPYAQTVQPTAVIGAGQISPISMPGPQPPAAAPVQQPAYPQQPAQPQQQAYTPQMPPMSQMPPIPQGRPSDDLPF